MKCPYSIADIGLAHHSKALREYLIPSLKDLSQYSDLESIEIPRVRI